MALRRDQDDPARRGAGAVVSGERCYGRSPTRRQHCAVDCRQPDGCRASRVRVGDPSVWRGRHEPLLPDAVESRWPSGVDRRRSAACVPAATTAAHRSTTSGHAAVGSWPSARARPPASDCRRRDRRAADQVALRSPTADPRPVASRRLRAPAGVEPIARSRSLHLRERLGVGRHQAAWSLTTPREDLPTRAQLLAQRGSEHVGGIRAALDAACSGGVESAGERYAGAIGDRYTVRGTTSRRLPCRLCRIGCAQRRPPIRRRPTQHSSERCTARTTLPRCRRTRGTALAPGDGRGAGQRSRPFERWRIATCRAAAEQPTRYGAGHRAGARARGRASDKDREPARQAGRATHVVLSRELGGCGLPLMAGPRAACRSDRSSGRS